MRDRQPVERDRQDALLRAEIESTVTACMARCEALARRHGARLPAAEIRFDLGGLAAGQFLWRPGSRPVLRFNLAMARRQPERFISATVAHEVAHLVTACCHRNAAPHGDEWQTVMAHLGIPRASRCHDYAVDETSVRRQRRWRYTCACRQHELSTTRHNRAQNNRAQYHCRHCGGQLHLDAPGAHTPANAGWRNGA
jgi:SprT protein